MRRIQAAALAVMLLLSGATAQSLAEPRQVASSQPAQETATTGGELRASPRYAPDAQECKFLRQINKYRKQNKLSALKLSASLGAAARNHSADMARHNYFSHTVKGQNVSWDRNIRMHGYKGNPVGENIAAGMEGSNVAFKAWKNSAGHRRNMLNRDFKSIGVGRAYDGRSRYGWYWTTTFGGPASDTVRC